VKLFKNILFFFVILLFVFCASSAQQKDADGYFQDSGEVSIPVRETETAGQAGTDYLTIIAAGDNLIHDIIIRVGLANGFDSMYDNIRDYILPADIAFINQETVIGNPSIGYSGYPQFSSPPELGASIAEAGFNIINHANNHVLDKGAAGVLSSIHFWDNYENIQYLGMFRSQEERDTRRVIIGKNNFKVGFLAYTYGTNGIPFPRDRSYLSSLIDQEKMEADIRDIRSNCDFLIVSLHWGEEYQFVQNRNQERLAAFLAQHQVDLVIGHHPHVLQPMEILERPDGKTMPVFYSLGNFFSAQHPKHTLLGGLMYIRLEKSEEEISIEEIGLIPVVTHYDANWTNFGVYPLHEYTEELAARHRTRQIDRGMTVDYFMNTARNMFGQSLILRNVFTD